MPPAWLAATILAIVIGIVYGRALEAPFIFDDEIAIIGNTSIQSLWPLIGTAEHRGPLNPEPQLPTSSRPIVNLSLALNYHFGGLNPAGYHATNIVIHFLSAMMVWAIMRRTLKLPYFSNRFDATASWLALAAAMLWSVHPLQTEAVIYTTQRTELMMAFFYLATLYCSLRYWSADSEPPRELQGEGELKPRRTVWLVLAAIACAAGMASKEVMVSAPIIVLLFERTFIAGSFTKSLRRSWPLYLALSATWLVLVALNVSAPRGTSAGFHLGISPFTWWMTQAKAALIYLKLVIWPSPLLLHYEFPYLTSLSDGWPYVVPVLLIGVLTLVLLWQNNPFGFFGAWVFAVLAPTSAVPIITEMAAERRMYLPLVALIAPTVVIAKLLIEWLSRRRGTARGSIFGNRKPIVGLTLLTLLFAFTYSLASVKRVTEYRNPLELWRSVVRIQPGNHIAHSNLAYYLELAGDFPGAMDEYREAFRLGPQLIQARVALSTLLVKTGRTSEAIDQLKEAARIQPNDAGLKNNLAFVLLMAGRFDEAISEFQQALKLDSSNWTIHKNMGIALEKAGRYPEAIKSFETSLRLNPQALGTYGNIAKTYTLANQPDKAIAALRRGLELAQSAGDIANAQKLSAQLNAAPKSQ